MFSPLWSTENTFGVFLNDSAELLKSKQSLVAENTALKQQIMDNEEHDILDTLIRKENDDLKNIFSRKSINQQEILAAVLVKPFLSPYDTLIIDRGSLDGISVGDTVLVNGDTYIGTLSEVYSNTSKVVLYSSPGEKTNVLLGNDAIEKEALGLGGGNFSVDISKESKVQIGDSVVIPSISPNIFATVEKIYTTSADSFETVMFRSPVNIDELKFVEVLPSLKK